MAAPWLAHSCSIALKNEPRMYHIWPQGVRVGSRLRRVTSSISKANLRDGQHLCSADRIFNPLSDHGRLTISSSARHLLSFLHVAIVLRSM